MIWQVVGVLAAILGALGAWSVGGHSWSVLLGGLVLVAVGDAVERLKRLERRLPER